MTKGLYSLVRDSKVNIFKKKTITELKNTTIYIDIDLLYRLIIKLCSIKPRAAKRPVYVNLCPSVIELKRKYCAAFQMAPNIDTIGEKIVMLERCLTDAREIKRELNDIYGNLLYADDQLKEIINKIDDIIGQIIAFKKKLNKN